MTSRTSQQKGQSSSSIQPPSISTSSASPYTFSLGRPGGTKPPPSPSQGGSRPVPTAPQSQNRHQLFSRPQSSSSALINNRLNFPTNTFPQTKSNARSASGHTKLAHPSAARVLAGSTPHKTELSTLHRPPASSMLRSTDPGARSNRPRPYSLTVAPQAVSESLAKIKTEEERWARIRYVREKAEQTRMELLALEQEERDLISPLMPSNPLNGQTLTIGIGTTSPLSPTSSPSPPVSPLSPAMTNDEDQCSDIDVDYTQRVVMAKRTWIKQPEHPTMTNLLIDNSAVLSPDDVEEVLNGHLSNFHEDLMDVTLSEMMNKHLMMLTDSDSGENSEGGAESLSPDSVNHLIDHDLLLSVSTKDIDTLDDESDTSGGLHPADTTIANQTFIFMSGLEREFDQQAISPGVPSLLEETIPMNNFADMTFMDYGHCAAMESREKIPPEHLSERILPLAMKINQAHSTQEEAAQEPKQSTTPRRTMLSPLNMHQCSILDEFLKSLPPLPSSPESQGNEQHLSQLHTAEVASPPPPRLVTLPAPIITSRERCQQLLEKKAGSAQRSFGIHLQEKPSPSSVQTSGSDSHESVFSTPLTSHPPSSGTSSQGLTSACGTSHEDSSFSFTAASAAQESETTIADTKPSLACSKKVTTREPDTRYKNHKKTAADSEQPLDMIVIRPARLTSFNAVDSCPSSPWSSLSSAASNTSSSSSVSSWSWSWPSSSSKTAEPTNIPSDLKHRDHKPRLPTTLCGPLIEIRSRSMSSLMKHQNGWLGFQALNIRLVASGRNHIVVVTKDNQVYSCWETDDEQFSGVVNVNEKSIEGTLGRSTRTEHGSGFVQDTTHQPGLVEFADADGRLIALASIVKVACSDHGTFVLTENGDLWGWGSFEDSKGEKASVLKGKASSRPIQICSQKIVSVACGRNHILILNIDGDVISWGVSTHGQLGRKIEQSQDSDFSPYFIGELPAKIIGIGAGKTFSFAWDEERLYGWGDNAFGQLGSPVRSKPNQRQGGDSLSSKAISIPKEISLHWKGRSIKQVQGGERHTVILTFSGLVIAMGNDDYGQLGVTLTPNASSASSPSTNASTDALSDFRASSMASIWSKIDIELRTGGDNQTKRKTRFYPALVRIGLGVSEVSCGDFHTVACSDNGQMYIWGQGYEGIVMIQNSDPMEGHGAYMASSASPAMPGQARLSPAADQSRRVVAVSAMRQASIALVH